MPGDSRPGGETDMLIDLFPPALMSCNRFRSRFLHDVDPVGRITVVFQGRVDQSAHGTSYAERRFFNAMPQEFIDDTGEISSEYALTYVIAGQVRFALSNQPGWGPVVATAGDLVVFNQLRHHTIQTEASPGFLECSACIDSAAARRLAGLGLWPSFEGPRFSIGRSLPLAHAYVELYEAIGDQQIRHPELMVRFIRIIQLVDGLIRATHDGSTFADRATRLLDEHPEPGYTLAEAARQLGMSVQHFSRRFLREVRMTPGRYQMRRRMDLALERLAHQSVADVARGLGYRDPAQFSRQFREIFGVPPSQLDRR